MFSPFEYEQKELSYMKIHQQIKKLVFSPPQLGGAMFRGVKKGFPVGVKIQPAVFGLMDPLSPHFNHKIPFLKEIQRKNTVYHTTWTIDTISTESQTQKRADLVLVYCISYFGE